MKSFLNSKAPYIIAETAYSFEGNYDYLLKQTINLPEQINAIKYHVLFDIDEYMVHSHPVYPLLNSWLLNPQQWTNIFEKAKEFRHDVVVLADCTDTIEFCTKNSNLIDAIEIHAACINDKLLLDKAAEFCNRYDKTFLLGISGFEVQELFDIFDYIERKNIKNIVLIYGFQNYPTKIENINLLKLKLFEEIFGYKVGYADHTEFDNPMKDQIILASYAIGCNIQEIHYVLDEGSKRTDYITGVSADRLMSYKDKMTKLRLALGATDLRLNEGEKDYLNFRKVPVAKRKIKIDEIISEKEICFKRVEKPNKKHYFGEEYMIVGKIANNEIKKDSEI